MTLAGFPHSDTPGSSPVCGSPRLIAACHVLHLSSSLAIHLLPSLHRHIQPHITRLCTMIIADPLAGTHYILHTSLLVMQCIDDFNVKIMYTRTLSMSKEVIRPQVPLRSPCYDFSLVTNPKFDNANQTSPR